MKGTFIHLTWMKVPFIVSELGGKQFDRDMLAARGNRVIHIARVAAAQVRPQPITTHDAAAAVEKLAEFFHGFGSAVGVGRGSFVTLTVTELAPNTYDVYTYAWDPAFTASKSVTVDVNGLGPILVSPPSDVFQGFVAGETHAVHTVVLGSGENLAITVVIVDDLAPAGCVNGFQVVPQRPDAVEAGTWGAIKARFER